MNKRAEWCRTLLNRIPDLTWVILIIIILVLMLSLNQQQAEKLPLSQPVGLYQSDEAIGASIYYNAQFFDSSKYEITRVERKEDGTATERIISEGTYEALSYGYRMEETATGAWQAITLDRTGFYWTDHELDRLTHFHQVIAYK